MAKSNVKVVVNPPRKPIAKESPKPPTQKVPKGYLKAEEGRYKCIKKCYFGISLYQKDAVYEAVEGEIIPYHFKKVKRVVEIDD